MPSVGHHRLPTVAPDGADDGPTMGQRQRAIWDDLSLEEVVVADLNFCKSVVGGPTSTPLKSTGLIVDLAGDVTIDVSSPAKLAEDVTVDVSSPADLAGNVTVGVSFLVELAGGVTVSAGPSAVAEVASSADLAGDVTTSVACTAIAEVASTASIAEVASLADIAEVASSVVLTEVASSAEFAGDVTVGATSLADPAGDVTAGVVLRQNCGNSVVVV